MAGIDLATATAKLQTWLAAEEQLAAGQRVTVEGQELWRAALPEVAERVPYWDQRVKRLSRAAGGSGLAIGRVRSLD